jgi:hypothetical protein
LHRERGESWNVERKKAAAWMILNIPMVPKCVVRDIAWSAKTGDGWTPGFKKRASRNVENGGTHSSEGRGQSAPVSGELVSGGVE